MHHHQEVVTLVSMVVLGGTNGPTLLGNKQVGGGGELRVNKEHEHLTPHIESTSTLHLTQIALEPYTSHLTPQVLWKYLSVGAN